MRSLFINDFYYGGFCPGLEIEMSCILVRSPWFDAYVCFCSGISISRVGDKNTDLLRGFEKVTKRAGDRGSWQGTLSNSVGRLLVD